MNGNTKSRRKIQAICHCLTGLIILSASFGTAGDCRASSGLYLWQVMEPQRAEAEEKLLMVFLDFDDLLCNLCTETLLSLCIPLPDHIQKDRTWMVVSVNSEELTAHQKKIIFRKIEGFLRGNGLCMPVCVDLFSSSNPLQRYNSHVLFLDEKNHSFTRYNFPLSRRILSQILEAILR